MITWMLLERDILKGVENLKLQTGKQLTSNKRQENFNKTA